MFRLLLIFATLLTPLGTAYAKAYAWPVRGEPTQRSSPQLSWVVSWDRPEKTALVCVLPCEGAPVKLTKAGVWPSTAPGRVLRVQVQGSAAEDVPLVALWTPADIAAWSGTGLRGAQVSSLAPIDDELWVATNGGLALWDGQQFYHLDRRSGLPGEALSAVRVQDAIRWVAGSEGIARIGTDGQITLSPQSASFLETDPSGAWVLDPGHRASHLVFQDDRLIVQERSEAPCDALIAWPPVALGACPFISDLPASAAIPALSALEDGVQNLVPTTDGAWAVRGGRLVRLSGTEITAMWTAPHRDVRAIARIDASLWIAAGLDGLWRDLGQGPFPIRATDGLPGTQALTIAQGPRRDTAWVGTDRGVALSHIDGPSAALPLAPLAAGIGLRSVIPQRKGVGVLSDDGLAWLGNHPPTGWASLKAAAGPHALALDWTAKTWLLLLPDALLSLDAQGQIHRFPTHSPAKQLLVTGNRAAILTDDGLRYWLPGASVLSARDPELAADQLWFGADASLWYTQDRQLFHADTSLPTSDLHVHALLPSSEGAFLATEQGLVYADTHGLLSPPAWEQSDTGPLLDVVASTDGILWALGADGRLWAGPPEQTPLSYDFQIQDPRALRTDGRGVWILAGDGLRFLRVR